METEICKSASPLSDKHLSMRVDNMCITCENYYGDFVCVSNIVSCGLCITLNCCG